MCMCYVHYTLRQGIDGVFGLRRAKRHHIVMRALYAPMRCQCLSLPLPTYTLVHIPCDAHGRLFALLELCNGYVISNLAV